MSADNWRDCPKCESGRAEFAEAKRDELEAAYGNVPMMQYEQIQQALVKASRRVDEFPKGEYSFREGHYGGTHQIFADIPWSAVEHPGGGYQERRGIT